jgi:outer membrane autotransporter protein
MKWSINRALLASVSPLAILVMTAGSAWAQFAADANVTVNGGNTPYTSSGTVTGPTASNGSNGSPGNGSNGNNSAGINMNASSTVVNVTGGTVTGGTGGNGGDGSAGAFNGGDGGDSAGIYVNYGVNPATISISQGATVQGGTGGNGGAAGGTGGTAGVNGGASGVDIRSANATLTNAGTVQSGTRGTNGSANGGTPATYNINNAAVAIGSAATGATINNYSTGQIIGAGGIGIAVGAANASITNRGTIATSGNAYPAIEIGSGIASTTITNYGTISSATSQNDTPTIKSSGTGTSIVNYGTISKSTNGTNDTAVSYHSGTGASTLTNYGTITGRIKASAFGDTFIFDGSQGGNTATGNITGEGSGTSSSIRFQGGTTTFTGNITESQSVTIANGSTLTLGGDSQIYSQGITLYSNSTFDLGTSKLTWNYVAGGSENLSQTYILKTTINTTSGGHGYWVFNDMPAGTMLNSGVPVITPTIVGSVATGAKYVIVQDTVGRTIVNMPTVVNSGGVRWTVSSVTGAGETDTDGVSYGTGYTNVILTSAGANAAAATTAVNSKGLSTLATYSGSNAAMMSLSSAVNNLTDSKDIEKAAAQLRPSTNGGTTQAALGAVGQAVNTISIRTDSVRAASADTGGTGVSSGEMLRGLGVWGQGFGSTATQDRRQDVDGYSADTYGLAFGADAKVLDAVRLGLSLAYARTNVADSGSRDGSGQDISSYIASLYGTYSAERWHVDGALTYGVHDYDGTRVINISGASRQTAKSSYAGRQYGAKAELGVPLPVGKTTVTPLLSLAYNHLSQDAYTETGAAAALSVGSSETDSIKSGLGAKVSTTMAKIGDWDIKPNARAIWQHEFNTSAQNQTSSYVDGGSSFTTAASEVARESFTLGIGVDMASVRNMTISAKYDAGLSDRFVSHTGSLQARMEF